MLATTSWKINCHGIRKTNFETAVAPHRNVPWRQAANYTFNYYSLTSTTLIFLEYYEQNDRNFFLRTEWVFRRPRAQSLAFHFHKFLIKLNLRRLGANTVCTRNNRVLRNLLHRLVIRSRAARGGEHHSTVSPWKNIYKIVRVSEWSCRDQNLNAVYAEKLTRRASCCCSDPNQNLTSIVGQKIPIATSLNTTRSQCQWEHLCQGDFPCRLGRQQWMSTAIADENTSLIPGPRSTEDKRHIASSGRNTLINLLSVATKAMVL